MATSEGILQDLRYGIRQLRLSPGFTAVAVLSLALGIGANTAMFQLIDAVRLRTLPVRSPEELVTVDFARGSARSGWGSSRSARMTYGNWQQIRTHQQAFSDVFVWSATRFNLATAGEARFAEGLFVSSNFFRALGVQPAIGRTHEEADDTPACGSPAAVLSYAFWQREYGASPDVLNRTISLEGKQFSIIGVTSPSFFGVEVGNRFDVAIPLCADPLVKSGDLDRLTTPHAWWLSMMGRLKPGWTVERATKHLETISPGIMQATVPPIYRPDMAKKYLANKLAATESGTGVSGLRRQYEQPLWVLMATTGLVLLIACANLANLLLARASIREREIAVRLAIGASRWHIIRQLLAESLLLSLLGAALGTGLAQLISRGLVAFITTSRNSLFVGLGIDWRVLGFTAGLAIATCLLFGLVPAMRATQLAPSAAMRAGGRGTTAGRDRFTLRRALVATQVALSLVLLVGALLFVRTLRNLMTVDPGFSSEGVVAVNVDLRKPKYAKQRIPVVYREIVDHMRAKPGVVSASQVWFTPLSGSGWNETAHAEGSSDAGKESYFNRAAPGYFKTMGTPIIAGRDFDDRDTLGSPKVAIVNEAWVKRFFGQDNPVGKTFRVEGPAGKPDPVYQIAGVVKNTKYYELREDFIPTAFLPVAQEEEPGPNATFVVRIAGPLGPTLSGIKDAVAAVSPELGLEFRPLSQQIKETLVRESLMATLSGGFGLLAAMLATLGLYGVISYMVARRRNEIGVRMALGAASMDIVRLVLREATILLGAGMIIGLLLAIWAGKAAATLLYGLQPTDPVTIAGAMCLLAAVALLASYGPARRAASLEPMTALRDE